MYQTIKKAKGVLVVALITSMLLLSMSALAGSGELSSASIVKDSDGAFGPIVPMYGAIAISGAQSAAATNTLWVALDPRGQGAYKTMSVAPGVTASTSVTNAITDDYRVLLDPAGALQKGCIGTGVIKN